MWLLDASRDAEINACCFDAALFLSSFVIHDRIGWRGEGEGRGRAVGAFLLRDVALGGGLERGRENVVVTRR